MVPMQIAPKQMALNSNPPQILAYVADLELEVDRLRKRSQFLQQETCDTINKILTVCRDVASADNSQEAFQDIARSAQELANAINDIRESPGYHPAHDQVVAIAIRPLIEQVFRAQQRLLGAQRAVLHLDLATECVEWFPTRLRHILDNLISNSLRYRDTDKGEARVHLALSRLSEGYQLRVSDNGVGMPWQERAEAFDLFYRAAPARAAGLGVGLAVVKLLVEQSGGTIGVNSGAGKGTSLFVVLPRYDVSDYLN